MAKNIKYIAPLLLIIGFLAFYFIKNNEQKPLRLLPHFGPKIFGSNKDTVFHQVKAFSFTDQNRNTITNETVKGKIMIVDYFFTTCQSICPKMSNQMERVQEAYKTDPAIVILSHTVDPEEDSVDVMAAYAKKHHAIKNKWYFLTGDKPALYEQARKSYLLDAEEGKGDEEDFIHTDKFALVDWNMNIRGYYSGVDSSEVNELISDIKLLLEEKKWKEKR